MTFLYKINKKGATAEGCITASDEAEAKAKLDAKFPKGSGVKVLDMEQVYVATIRNTRMSAFKGRPLAGACQGLPASEALKLVEFSPKKAATRRTTTPWPMPRGSRSSSASSTSPSGCAATGRPRAARLTRSPAACATARSFSLRRRRPRRERSNMGQKVNPVGFRVGVTHAWGSRWFAPKKMFGAFLVEDQKIRDVCKKRLAEAGISRILVERYANRVRVTLFSARPGVIIGHKGGDVEAIRAELEKMTKKEVYIEIKEVQGADADAQLVAEGIAQQLERRIALKRAMKRAMKVAMDMGVDGIKVHAGGRINGAEIARVEWSREGKVPLHTLRANIDYGFAEANTTAGKIGIKVWICKKEGFQARQPRGERRGERRASRARGPQGREVSHAFDA